MKRENLQRSLVIDNRLKQLEDREKILKAAWEVTKEGDRNPVRIFVAKYNECGNEVPGGGVQCMLTGPLAEAMLMYCQRQLDSEYADLHNELEAL